MNRIANLAFYFRRNNILSGYEKNMSIILLLDARSHLMFRMFYLIAYLSKTVNRIGFLAVNNVKVLLCHTD